MREFISKLAMLVFFANFANCAARSRPKPQSPSLSQQERYAKMQDRVDEFGPWIVSHNGDVEANQGDSLFFSGLALYGLDCDHGLPIAQAIVEMLHETGGGLYRHPTIKDKVSMDGALALYTGIVKRMDKCDEFEQWQALMALHKDFLDHHAQRLNAAASVVMPAGFDFVQKALFAKLSLAGSPGSSQTLEEVAATWSAGTLIAHQACYRVHLSLLALKLSEDLGYPISQVGRTSFCSITNGYGLETVDHWCGRGGLSALLDTFEPNQWQYKFQRCHGWETPDGGGIAQPGIDYIVGYHDLTGL